MSSGGSRTKQHWETLYHLVELYLREQYAAQEQWTYQDLLKATDLQDSTLLRELASQAGFDTDGGLSRRQENLILRQIGAGERDPHRIGAVTGLTQSQVEAGLVRIGLPFGMGGYGDVGWSGGGQVEATDLQVFSPRRISARGQISFEGKTYSVGLQYRHNICWVRTAAENILIHFPNRKTIALSK